MKKFLSSFLLSISLVAVAQGPFYSVNFDSPLNLNHIYIPNTTNNLWQIGTPAKPVFNSAYSSPRVIVTDTILFYPPNNTSFFIIKHKAGAGFTTPHTASFGGRYNVNSDTLLDTGKIEFSPNNGTTWIDLLNPGTYSNSIMWATPKPVLTGNSNGWKYFGVFLEGLGPVFNIQAGDTVLYRLSFASDSVHTYKDGLMYDNFDFQDYVEGIIENKNNGPVFIYPNPASNELFLSGVQNGIHVIQIINSLGEVIIEDKTYNGLPISTKNFPNGIYFLRYLNANNSVIKKFRVEH